MPLESSLSSAESNGKLLEYEALAQAAARVVVRICEESSTHVELQLKQLEAETAMAQRACNAAVSERKMLQSALDDMAARLQGSDGISSSGVDRTVLEDS